MRFLIDAQLPARLAQLLNNARQDALHTSSLSAGNRTTDSQITDIADAQGRVVVTKDRDFRNAHMLSQCPRRLLVVTTGNISNTALLKLFEAHLDSIIVAFRGADFVELSADALFVHRRRADDASP